MSNLVIKLVPRGDVHEEVVEIRDLEDYPYALVHSDLFWPKASRQTEGIYYALQSREEVTVELQLVDVGTGIEPAARIRHADLLEDIIREWEPGDEDEAQAVDDLLEWLRARPDRRRARHGED